VFQVAGNLLREDKRIGASEEALKGGHLRDIGLRGGPDSLQGGLWPIVPAKESGTAALLAHQLHRGLKEILKQPQIRIEGIECLLSFQGLVAVPADELAHMRPILLLDMGVVIFFIGPGAGELDAVSPTERDQMPVDELAPIVRVESPHGKR